MSEIAKTPKPPYYAVIFTAMRTSENDSYEEMMENTKKVVSEQKGFLGYEIVTDKSGLEITISYWDSLESINVWKNNIVHREAKDMGKKQWYSQFITRICKVENDYFSENNL